MFELVECQDSTLSDPILVPQQSRRQEDLQQPLGDKGAEKVEISDGPKGPNTGEGTSAWWGGDGDNNVEEK